jgi:hypothetical protein
MPTYEYNWFGQNRYRATSSEPLTLALDKVKFGTNWLADPEAGGFYQALADGTYEKYGLDVRKRSIWISGAGWPRRRPPICAGRWRKIFEATVPKVSHAGSRSSRVSSSSLRIRFSGVAPRRRANPGKPPNSLSPCGAR